MAKRKFERESNSLNGNEIEQESSTSTKFPRPLVAKPSRRLLHTDYTVGWICALPIELTAARVMLDEVHEELPNPPGDDNVYALGSISGHNVVISCLPAGVYGTTSATTVGIGISNTYPNTTKTCLIVGIGGGVPRTLENQGPDIRLGDVVVSTPTSEHPAVIHYDYGKTVKNGVSVSKGTLNKPARILLNAIAALRSKHDTSSDSVARYVSEAVQRYDLRDFAPPDPALDVLHATECEHVVNENSDPCSVCDSATIVERHPRADRIPRIHYGTIASGNQVIKHGHTRDRIARQHAVLCFEMEAAGLMDLLSPVVIRGICDYCDSKKEKTFQRYAALAAAAYGKELLSMIPRSKPAQDEEAQHQRTGKDNATLAKIMLSDPRLDKRRIEATKGGLLRNSYRWVLENSEFKAWQKNGDVLWIRGDPGKGKTMLLCGVINEVQAKSAYFFCQANNENINTGIAVLRGLIYMLADENPALIPFVSKRLDKSNNIFDTNSWFMLSQILEDLIMQERYTIIIDALDECIDGRKDLLKLILDNRDKASWMVSSRNWPEIEDSLRRAPCLSLEINSAFVSQAIEYYIQFKVDELTDAKDLDKDTKDNVLMHLRQHANGTFLWVALVCASLATAKRRHVKITLQQFPSGLDAVYSFMWQTVEGSEDAALLQRILAVCTLVVRPLVLDELKTIIDLPEDAATSLEEVVQDCGSFLSIKANVIEFVHQSAKEYVDKRNRVESKSLHKEIFSRSISTLSKVLKPDICGLKDPATPIVKAVLSRIKSDPLAGYQYACVNWIHHLLECGEPCGSEQSLLQQFLMHHYLPWLEAMSLLRSIATAISALYELEALSERSYIIDNDRNESTEAGHVSLKSLSYDARRFVQYFRDIIEVFPLQIYHSGPLFSPEESMFRRSSSAHRTQSIEVTRYSSQRWSPLLAAINMHPVANATVTTLSYSNDSEYIVVGYSDGLMQIWYLKSMLLMHSITILDKFVGEHDYCVRSVMLPHKVLCCRFSGAVSIWDLKTKQITDIGISEVLNISRYGILAFREKPNLIRFMDVAETPHKDYARLNLDLYIAPEKYPYALSQVPSLVFAMDSKTVAVRTAIDRIEIWSIEPVHLRLTIFTGKHQYHAIALSSKYLSICESCKQIRVCKRCKFEYDEHEDLIKAKWEGLKLYDTSSGSLISVYPVDTFPVEGVYGFDNSQVEISQDNKYIAFTNHSSYVYEIASGTCVWRTHGNQYSWLSPDNRYMVSLSGSWKPGSFCMLQDFVTIQNSNTRIDRIIPTYILSVAPNGSILVSASYNPHETIFHVIGSDMKGLGWDGAQTWQHSTNLTLIAVQDSQESCWRILRIQAYHLEEILEVGRTPMYQIPVGPPSAQLVFAPNDLYLASYELDRRVIIYNLETKKEILSIECEAGRRVLIVKKLEWSLDSRRVLVSGTGGFILVDIDSQKELLRDYNAVSMGFSEDGMSLMIWHDTISRATKNVALPKIIPTHQESHYQQHVSDDDAKYEAAGGRSSFSGTGTYNEAQYYGITTGVYQDVRGGQWIEWSLITNNGRILKYFNPSLFLVQFRFNSHFLVALEASGRSYGPNSLTIRVWDRLSGRQVKYESPYSSLSVNLQGETLSTECGVMVITRDGIKLGSRDRYFYDGRWLWLENKRTIRVPNEYRVSRYNNGILAINRDGGTPVVLRFR